MSFGVIRGRSYYRVSIICLFCQLTDACQFHLVLVKKWDNLNFYQTFKILVVRIDETQLLEDVISKTQFDVLREKIDLWVVPNNSAKLYDKSLYQKLFYKEKCQLIVSYQKLSFIRNFQHKFVIKIINIKIFKIIKIINIINLSY